MTKRKNQSDVPIVPIRASVAILPFVPGDAVLALVGRIDLIPIVVSLSVQETGRPGERPQRSCGANDLCADGAVGRFASRRRIDKIRWRRKS